MPTFDRITNYAAASAPITSDSFSADGGSGSGRSLVLIIGWKDEGTTVNNPSVSSVTYGGVALTFRARARQQYAGNGRSVTCEVWTLDNPASGSNTLAYTLSEESTHKPLASAAIYTAAGNGVGANVGSATGASNAPAVTFTSLNSDSMVVGGLFQDAQTTYTAGTDDTERADHPNTSGLPSMWVGDTPGISASVTLSASSGSTARWSMVAAELLASGEPPPLPTVVLNTADESVLSTLPTLEFTGTDDEADDLTYNIGIADNAGFLDGLTVTESLTTGSGTPIHPNPVGGTTWEGHRQVDDRLGMGFQGSGGILDSVEFFFGAHETSPEDTDGSYLARVYEAEGYPVDPVPSVWQASTGYSVDDIVRPTSSANANVHFVYRCKVAGTSDSSEPTWPGNGVNWQSVTPGAEVSDGTVTWEALPGLHPVDAADEAATPTAGWLAQSVVYAFAPGVSTEDWRKLDFEDANRIRTVPGKWYMVILDWRPNSDAVTNTIKTTNASLTNAVAAGNVYLDGPGTNNGARIIEDSWFRIREDLSLLSRVSDTDAGFVNTVDGGDTDPFTSGQKVSFTVQVADELAAAAYYWRVRATNLAGYGDWSATRSFTASDAGGVDVTPDPASAVAASVAPGVVLGSIAVSVTPVSSIALIQAPSVVLGSISYSPDPSSAVSVSVDPDVIFGSLSISPDPSSAVVVVVDPDVVLASISYSPSAASAVTTTIDPTVDVGGGIDVTPDPVTAVTTVVAPAVMLGSISVSPDPASTVPVVVTPSIVLGSLSVAPDPASAVVVVVAPSVVLGSLSISPDPSSAVIATVDPTVDTGSGIDVTPDPVTTVATVVAPDVVLGSLSVSPTAASAVISSIDPAVELGFLTVIPGAAFSVVSIAGPDATLGSVSVSPVPVSAIALVVDPTVLAGSAVDAKRLTFTLFIQRNVSVSGETTRRLERALSVSKTENFDLER